MRQGWEKKEIRLSAGETIRSTFSGGIAEFRDGEDVLEAADAALYEAKNAGRNRIVQKQKLKLNE